MNSIEGYEALRSGELQELVVELQAPGSAGAVVQTGFGSGQKYFVSDLMHFVAMGHYYSSCLRIQGISGQEDISFGVVLGIIDEEFEPDDIAKVVRLLHEKLRRLRGTSGKRTLIIVEDAQYLDEATAFALTQMVQAKSATIVLLAPAPIGEVHNLDPFRGLGVLPNVKLGLLTDSDVARLVEKACGYPPTTGCVAMLSSLSGRIHDLLQLAIDRITALNEWKIVAGYCFFSREQSDADGVLLESIWTGLQELRQEDFEALSVLYMLGRYRVEDYSGPFPLAMGRLLDCGLARIDYSQTAYPTANLVDYALHRFLGPSEIRRLFDFYYLKVDEQYRDSRWRTVYWSIMAGYRTNDQELVESARQANNECQFEMALLLAMVDGPEPQSVKRRIQALRSLGGRYRMTECLAGLEDIVAQQLDQEDIQELTSTWMVLLMNQHEYAERYAHAAQAWTKLKSLPAGLNNVDLLHRINLAELISRKVPNDQLARQLGEFLDPRMPIDVRLVATIVGLENRAFDHCDPLVVEVTAHNGFRISKGLALRIQVAQRILKVENGDLGTKRPEQLEQLELSGNLSHVLAAVQGCIDGIVFEQQGDYASSRAALLQSALDFSSANMNGFALYGASLFYMQTPDAQADSRLANTVGWVAGQVLLGPPLYRVNNHIAQINFDDSVSRDNRWQELMEQLLHSEPESVLKVLWHLLRFKDPTMILEDNTFLSAVLEPIPKMPGIVANLIHQLLAAVPGRISMMKTVREQAERLQIHSLAVAASSCILMSESATQEDRAGALQHLYSLDKSFTQDELSSLALQQHGLSQRELEIAAMVAVRKSNKEIASKLSLSVRTVEGHIYRVLSKLGFQQRSSLGQLNSLATLRTSSEA